MDTNPNAVAPTKESMEDMRQKLSAEADRADIDHDLPAASPSSTNGDSPAPSQQSGDTNAPGEVKKPDSPETSAQPKIDKTGRAHGDGGKFLPKEDKAQPQEQAQKPQEQEQAPAPQLTKEQKDAARYDRNWEKLQTERRQLEAEKQRIAIEKQVAQAVPPVQPRFSVENCLQARDEFLKQAENAMAAGDMDKAKEHLDMVKKAETEAQRLWDVEATEKQRYESERATALWNANAAPILAEHPELADNTTEEFEEMKNLLDSRPYLYKWETGFQDAYEVLQMRKSHAEVSGLREENKRLKEENDRYKSLTAPEGGSVPSGHGAPQDMSKLPLKEQQKLLRRDAARE